jgi:energy-coupling factor transporter ATP-binding protein EcfA2
VIIKNIQIQDWNQFDNINITFHPRITVLTGANGAGKSTILRMFSRLIGWGYNETATPFKKSKALKFKWGNRKRNISPAAQGNYVKIGSINLENGSLMNIEVPELSASASYGTRYNPHYGIRGLNIPSHRTAYSYKPITNIPIRPLSRQQAFDSFNSLLINRLLGTHYTETPSFQMKTTLVSLALFGKGNEYVQQDEEAYELFLGFINILKILLPPTLGFETISVRSGEVILETKSGEFLLDAVSGGIGAILDLAWQIYMFDGNKGEPYIVIIDEAENHLHASMQRTLMPNLLKAFPNAQFVISTHSPLMVNSIRDSAIYVLRYNEHNLVVSEPLDFVNKAANANEILRDVLGVPVTMPIWVENKLEDILQSYKGIEITPENYLRLREELVQVGLKDHFPQALGLLQGGHF